MTLRRLSLVADEICAAEAFLAMGPVSNDGISLELRRRAELLHLNHRVPYVLSRLAASAALSSSLRTPIAFSGSREDAQQYGASISLAHEDLVGAAVVWSKDAPYAFGIDVVDVQQVSHITNRFPHFGSRMMPRCTPSCLSAADVLHVQKTYGDIVDPFTIVLAQHWGLRECCIKLVGISWRSFSFDSFRGPKALFPECFSAHVVDSGRDALLSAGLSPNLIVSCWAQAVKLSSGGQKLYVVVAAASSRR